MQRLRVDLFPSSDTDGKTIYVGRLRFPGIIKFDKGAAFLVYTSVSGQEELHICPLDSPDISNVFDYYNVQRIRINRSRYGNLPVKLETRYEKENTGKKFYIGKLEFKGHVDCEKGLVFLVFTADEGEEELQIGVLDPEKLRKRKINSENRAA